MAVLEAPAGTRVVVVGGANTDIVGTSAEPLIARDSNPGEVRLSPGGVGRNIAENLARLGVETHLLTAFGADATSGWLAEQTRSAGVLTGQSLRADDLPGAWYVAINDADHDLALAVNDMRVLARLTPSWLAEDGRRELLEAADAVVVDANLSEETLNWIAGATSAPLFADTVSAPKALRLAGLLGRLEALKPNAHEVEALLGQSAHDLESAEAAARGLVDRGVRRAFVTPGRAGIAWAAGDRSGQLAAPRLEPVNTSGAGDAFMAGVVYAALAGVDVEVQARFASALSIIALESAETVSPLVSQARVVARMKELYG